jgi:hypothetical protein
MYGLAKRCRRARKRRIEDLLERVDDVVRVELLPVVEEHALPQVEHDPLRVDDVVARGQRGTDVQLRVPLEERVVHHLVRRVVHRERRSERIDPARILLECPGGGATCRDLLRGGSGRARRRARGTSERACRERAGTDLPCLDEQGAAVELALERLALGRLVC